MEGSALIVFALNSLVSLVLVSIPAGILFYRQNKRHLNSQSEVNEANAELIEGQINIEISKEARELLNIYKDNAREAREDAAKAKREAEKADARLEWLVEYLRSQQIQVPDWPVELR